MDSPNVEHLLQNYKVSDIIQIQKRLKNDVDKKKSDLKTLIGERYNELLDATDSIEHMKCSVNHLIGSLKDLGAVLDKTQTVDHNNATSLDSNSNDYTKAVLSKILFDLPLQVWNSLESENFILATYSYFYGMSIYKLLRNENRQLLQHRLHHCNQLAIGDLSHYIVEHCWKCVAKQSASNEIDHSKFADIFACILLLKDCDVNCLINEFYTRQAATISSCLHSDCSLSALLEKLLNIILNTIKCSRVFYQDSNYEALLVQRYRRIINSTYASNLHKHSITKILNSGILQYKICDELNRELDKLGCNLNNNDKIKDWVMSMKIEMSSILESKVKHVVSIKQIHHEISSTEQRLNSDHKFTEWEDYIDIVDVNACIWQECIKSVFEKRVYQIAQEKIDSIINDVDTNALLCTSLANLLSQCDTNMVELIWKDPASVNRTSEFQNVISKSCDIVSTGFRALFDDVGALKEHYQSYLSNIYAKVFEFFTTLQERINRLQSTKQFILFGAVFFDKLLHSIPSIKDMFDLQPQSHATLNMVNWLSLESKIKAISDSYFCRWFEFIVSSHFANFNADQFVDLNQFVQNLTYWDKVAIMDEQSTDKSTATNSVMEVPMQISLSLHLAIEGICADINKQCGYMLSRAVLIYVLSLIGQNMFPIYRNAIEQIQMSHFPHTAKQTISIQLYFDLFFIKNLFTTAKDEALRANQLTQANELLTALESMIDPFDLHIMFPFIKTNSEKLFRSCSIIFGFLFADKNVLTALKTENAAKPNETVKEVKHNIMLVHSCEATFANL